MPRLSADDLAVLLVDVQPHFLDMAHGQTGPVLARLYRLLRLCDLLSLPLVATFERPVEEKGALSPAIEDAFPKDGQRFEKSTFDALGEPEIRDALKATGCSTVVVAGSETDVCVLQSVLGLLEHGYRVALLEDCLFTSEENPESALHRMRALGVTPCTFKTLAYELLGTVDRTAWPRGASGRIEDDPELFEDPEDLPPKDGDGAEEAAG